MNDGGGISAFAVILWIAGPVTGLAIWISIQSKYRNRGARYKPEDVVKHTVASIKKTDTFTKDTVTEDSSLSGRNETNHHVRAKTTKMING